MFEKKMAKFVMHELYKSHFEMSDAEMVISRGQLISTCLFGFFNSSKKRTKISTPVGYSKNYDFQVRFLEKLKTSKRD